MSVQMDTLHPDSVAIDRVGYRAIQDHFDITSGAVAQWKKRGVPKNCRRPLALLGRLMGHEMPEFPVVTIKTQGDSPSSSASPA